MADLRECVRIARRVFAQRAFDAYHGAELLLGADVVADAQLDAFVRANAETAYHPSCTCRMGVDEAAVVDPQLGVVDIDGLLVVDASVMPSIVSGNLNAPVVVVAEKAADMILGRDPLPRSTASVASLGGRDCCDR